MADTKPGLTKTLEVVGVGEVEVRPQLATITLILSACKQSLEECRTSVDKRQPYVHHTLYSNQARREDITEREECRSNVSHIMLTVTIMATLPSQFVQPVLSTLTEKLSDAVEVENVVYHHSWSAVAEGRAVAGRRAALEARRRASEMAAAVGGEVGPCITLSEEACDHLARTDDHSEWSVVETPLRLRHAHAHTPTIIKSRVKAAFVLAAGLPKITAS
ncbi:Interleukin-1 receptor-associated kinase 1-binding protein 1 [Chionoecetes opilio]|uniref:Interleukin-1 receptor-associated kinase 1-binding protein 1 n=1 Tax=Chionoecetes opilio TaxID=41210 RepID=A0A8J4YEW8_CHIOP|nr:Interleukin-1 receptor-associated kinase 1-binding protein 1 [Chionoecetes opilio]